MIIACFEKFQITEPTLWKKDEGLPIKQKMPCNKMTIICARNINHHCAMIIWRIFWIFTHPSSTNVTLNFQAPCYIQRILWLLYTCEESDSSIWIILFLMHRKKWDVILFKSQVVGCTYPWERKLDMTGDLCIVFPN